ncbi:protein sel-1 [Carpediemonas membranifera]|uniref:Protein sel-1 n=1 Tax=Carpediemonas membranifera TaxID=201153 RepID=A0A8J6E2E0_9EUKA|nr:protein sel-1 [Carpediemonas membranifera]|eukprot:KAG9394211.1 protein sel-1 [Carpediemonas membranifera]
MTCLKLLLVIALAFNVVLCNVTGCYEGVARLLSEDGNFSPRFYDFVSNSAKQGDPVCQFYQGMFYKLGLGVEQSDIASYLNLGFAHRGGNNNASLAIAYQAMNRADDDGSCMETLGYVREAVDDFLTTLSGGIRFIETASSPHISRSDSASSEVKYAHRLKLQADAGDENAMLDYGLFILRGGYVVEADEEAGVEYITRAYRHGDSAAAGLLGNMHLRGAPGIKKSNATAYALYKESADVFDPVGLNGLGMCYRTGVHVAKNLTMAQDLLEAARDSQQLDAWFQLALLFKEVGLTEQSRRHFDVAFSFHHAWATREYADAILEWTGECRAASLILFKAAQFSVLREVENGAFVHYLKDRPAHALLDYLQAAFTGGEVAIDNVESLLATRPGLVEADPIELSLRLRLMQYSAFPAHSRAAVHVSSIYLTHPDVASRVLGLDQDRLFSSAVDILTDAADSEGVVGSEASYHLAALRQSPGHRDPEAATKLVDKMYAHDPDTLLLWAWQRLRLWASGVRVTWGNAAVWSGVLGVVLLSRVLKNGARRDTAL